MLLKRFPPAYGFSMEGFTVKECDIDGQETFNSVTKNRMNKSFKVI
jgi:hypothetical protein